MSRVCALICCLLVIGCANAASSFWGMTDCESGAACRPWPGLGNKACTRGERMDIRFSLEVARSRSSHDAVNGSYSISSSGGGDTRVNIYESVRPFYFCAVVDQLQAFLLNNSASLAATNRPPAGISKPTSFSTAPNVTRLSVFGMGNVDNPLIPTNDDDSSVVLYQANVSACPSNGPAIVNFLVLNVTMTKGVYRYTTNFQQAIQVGFKPTCDHLGCLLSSSAAGGPSVCIGDAGKQNCATCVTLDTVADNDVKIWTSYYGTDSNGRVLTSGGQNPLAFRQFAADPIVDTVVNSVKKVTDQL